MTADELTIIELAWLRDLVSLKIARLKDFCDVVPNDLSAKATLAEWRRIDGKLAASQKGNVVTLNLDDYTLCDCCRSYATSTHDEDGDGTPLGHIQCAQCSRIAELESQLAAFTHAPSGEPRT